MISTFSLASSSLLPLTVFFFLSSSTPLRSFSVLGCSVAIPMRHPSTPTPSSQLILVHPIANPPHYRSLVGTLRYLTFTHLGIAHAVQQVCLYMHDPRESQFQPIKRIIRYVKDTIKFGLQTRRTAPSCLTVCSDAEWANCLDTR